MFNSVISFRKFSQVCHGLCYEQGVHMRVKVWYYGQSSAYRTQNNHCSKLIPTAAFIYHKTDYRAELEEGHALK